MKLRTILIMVAVLIALGITFYFVSQPEPPEEVEPQYFVWDVDMDELRTMDISLPLFEMNESWVRHEDKYWYFDEPDGPKVDMQRWGGGIPLLLSGPGANRRIAEEASDELLEEYGFDNPVMLINLTLSNGRAISIEVADNTLTGEGYYIKLKDRKDVYTVDYTWFQVLARLVIDPPYPKPEEEDE
jgi:hypothetical protein